MHIWVIKWMGNYFVFHSHFMHTIIWNVFFFARVIWIKAKINISSWQWGLEYKVEITPQARKNVISLAIKSQQLDCQENQIISLYSTSTDDVTGTIFHNCPQILHSLIKLKRMNCDEIKLNCYNKIVQEPKVINIQKI